jgi:hypothetical protein
MAMASADHKRVSVHDASASMKNPHLATRRGFLLGSLTMPYFHES